MRSEQTHTRQKARRVPAAMWLALLLLGAAPLGAVRAEEADAGTGNETAKSSPEQSDTGSGSRSKDEPSQNQGKPSADVFIPSEEISEDFAVSFPVDI